MRSFRLCLLAATVVAALATSAFGRTWYIRPDGTGDAPTIQAGVDSAATDDIVLVAAGTYSTMSNVIIDGTPTAVCVSINKNIRLLSEDGPAVTTIGNTAAVVVVYMQSVDSSGEVNGFTIRSRFGGFGCIGPFPTPPPAGSTFGLMCQASTPRIEGNRITDNMVGIELNASPALITGNTIDDAGYGIECRTGSDAYITENTIDNCGLSISSEYSALQIVGNDMSTGCSAISGFMSSFIIRENSIHDFDSSGIQGRSEFLIEDNVFFNLPGSIYFLGQVVTATIRGNVFYNVGSAAQLSSNPGVTIENNTIDGASIAISCENASPTIRNNIIVHSGGALICSLSSSPIMECNNIFDVAVPFQGVCADPTGINGNIAVDPQFCGVPGSHNYTLQGDSPCAAGNHPDGDDCGLIGAKGVACGTVPTKSMTWGQFKKLYDKKR